MVVEMKKTQREAELVAARRAIEKVALKEHKAVEEVRTAMIEAMTEGFNSKDPSARAMWAQIPCEGEMPTPEELIAWVGKGLNGGQCTSQPSLFVNDYSCSMVCRRKRVGCI